MKELQSHSLCLRPFRDEDAEAFAEAARESVATVGRWMPWCHAAYSAAEARAWFASCAATRLDASAFEFGVFAADGRQLLGGAGLNQFNRQHRFCNLGYWVRESSQRQGVATAAIGMLANFGFVRLGLTRVEIVVAEGNEASSGVAKKAGARFECLARNRLTIAGAPVNAAVFSLIP
jgi:ribosomal-protein-serine acetyltransferase